MKKKSMIKGFTKLWAPWRMKYIEKIDTKREKGCIFCNKPAQNLDDSNFIVHRGKHCFVILNLYPYNNGHVMVIPYKHTSVISTLNAETMLEMMQTVDLAMRALTEVMCPNGYNVGMNIGRAAGAGIAEHIHMHIVPRWNGDTNFMPVIGCTKVICEAPEDTYAKLKPVIERLYKEQE